MEYVTGIGTQLEGNGSPTVRIDLEEYVLRVFFSLQPFCSWYPHLSWWNISHRIHGAAIYGNMDLINMSPMLAYIPAPWILWVLESVIQTMKTSRFSGVLRWKNRCWILDNFPLASQVVSPQGNKPVMGVVQEGWRGELQDPSVSTSVFLGIYSIDLGKNVICGRMGEVEDLWDYHGIYGIFLWDDNGISRDIMGLYFNLLYLSL